MADLGGITINVGVHISYETVQRCCEILRMFLMDNPDKIVMSEQGEYPAVWISDRNSESEE